MLLLIVALILVGVILLIVELVLLPGISIAGLCALGAYGGASYLAFDKFGNTIGIIVVVTIIVLSVIATVISLKSKTWSKLALNDELKGSSQAKPEHEGIKIGDMGEAITRLAPIGKIKIGDQIYEAKSFDVFIDQATHVEVVGFDNFSIIVKKQTK